MMRTSRRVRAALTGALMLTAGVGLAPIIAPTACACDCAEPDPSAQFERAQVVVRGTVEREQANGMNKLIHHVRVSSVHKGSAAQVMQVHSLEQDASCGVRFRKGDEVVVFAYQDAGHWATDLCSGTGRATAAALAELAKHPGAAPTAAPEPAPARSLPGRRVLAVLVLTGIFLAVAGLVGLRTDRLRRR